jgi:hypothetical protein
VCLKNERAASILEEQEGTRQSGKLLTALFLKNPNWLLFGNSVVARAPVITPCHALLVIYKS